MDVVTFQLLKRHNIRKTANTCVHIQRHINAAITDETRVKTFMSDLQ